jgi:hypothetical protein
MIQRVVEESGVGRIDLHLPRRCGATAAPVRPVAEEDIAFPPPAHDRRVQPRQPTTGSRGRRTAPRSKPFVGAGREADEKARTIGESHAIPEKANVETRPAERPAPADKLGARERYDDVRLAGSDDQGGGIDQIKTDVGHNELGTEGHVVTGVGHNDSCLAHCLGDEHRIVAACFVRLVERVLPRPACSEQVGIVAVTGDARDENLGLGGPVNQLQGQRPRPIQPLGKVC